MSNILLNMVLVACNAIILSMTIVQFVLVSALKKNKDEEEDEEEQNAE